MDSNTATDLLQGDMLVVAVTTPSDVSFYEIPERLICSKSRYFSRIRVSTPRREVLIEMPTEDYDAAIAFFDWLYTRTPRPSESTTREALIADYYLSAALEAPEYRDFVIDQLKSYVVRHGRGELKDLLQEMSELRMGNTAFSDFCAREVAYAMEESMWLKRNFVAMLQVVEGWGLNLVLETRVKDEIERYQGDLSLYRQRASADQA